MKLIVLLFFILGAFCFAAKDALDARTAAVDHSKQLVMKTNSDTSSLSSKVSHRS